MSSFVNKELKPLWNTNQFSFIELNMVSKFMFFHISNNVSDKFCSYLRYIINISIIPYSY